MTQQDALKGIAIYQDQREWLLGIIDKHGGHITQYALLNAVVNKGPEIWPWSPEAFIFDPFHGPQGQYLELVGAMIVGGIITRITKDGEVAYMRSPGTHSHP
jgi:hypothetical protein